MEELESESRIAGTQPPGEVAPPETQAPAPVSALLEVEEYDDVLPPAVRQLINRCMTGEEPYGRELKTGEFQKFSPQHVQMVLMRSAGMRQNEIASLLGVTAMTVGSACRHPYGKKIIFSMMHRQGVQVVDLRGRLEAYANDLLAHTMELAIISEDIEQVSKVTFGLLDRAGYGPKATATDGRGHKTGASAEASAMEQLANALGESTQADRIASNFRQIPAPDIDLQSSDPLAGVEGPLRAGEHPGAHAERDSDLDGMISEDPDVVAVIRGHTIRKAARG